MHKGEQGPLPQRPAAVLRKVLLCLFIWELMKAKKCTHARYMQSSKLQADKLVLTPILSPPSPNLMHPDPHPHPQQKWCAGSQDICDF
eukprot:1139838-Pelagomonas_calceolata.AAC.3